MALPSSSYTACPEGYVQNTVTVPENVEIIEPVEDERIVVLVRVLGLPVAYVPTPTSQLPLTSVAA
jgi:hypothetical protein